MKTLRNLLYTFIAALMTLTALSCDRMDDNGRFEGYWHLIACEGGELTADTDVAWGVRNELIQMQDLHKNTVFYFCTFRRTEHQLQLLEAFENDGTNDIKVAFSEIPAKFHIPADGRFDVVTLNGHELVLRSQGVTLRFKKN